MKRSLAISCLMAVMLAACGGGEQTETTLAATTTQNTATAPESSSSSVAETTTTTASADEATFAITAIDFADDTIEITNVGSSAASLSGYRICQRPSYSDVSENTLGPGESIIIDASVVDGFDPANGELGLYVSGSFDSSDDIVSYVEWGRSGHGRSSVAVAAGIWPADSFVATTSDTNVIATAGQPATTPDGWLVG